MKMISTLFLLLLSGTLTAQFLFEPGYVINAQGERISGLVAVQSNGEHFKNCFFKLGDAVSEYNSTEIKAYGFDGGRKYLSGIVDLKFVSVLVEGTASLYQINEQLYVTNQKYDGRLVNINMEKVKVKKNGVDIMVQDSKWKGFLNAILNDCPNINVEKLIPNAASIGDAVIQYNTCVNSEYTDLRSAYNPKLRSGLFISAGVAYNNVKVVEQNYNDDPLDNFNAIGFRLGASYEVYPFRLSPKLGFGLSLDYSSANMEESFEPYVVGSVERKHNYRLELRSVSLSLMVKRDIPLKDNLKLTFFGGPFINYSGQSNYYADTETRDLNTDITTTSRRYSLKLDNLVEGGIVGFTVLKKIKSHALGLKVDYTVNGKMNYSQENFVYLTSKVSHIGVSLTYGLN